MYKWTSSLPSKYLRTRGIWLWCLEALLGYRHPRFRDRLLYRHWDGHHRWFCQEVDDILHWLKHMTSMRLWWEYRPLYKDNLFIVPSWPEQNTLQEILIFRNQEAKHCPLYFCSKVTQLNFKWSFRIHCKGCLFFYVSYYDWVWCWLTWNLFVGKDFWM